MNLSKHVTIVTIAGQHIDGLRKFMYHTLLQSKTVVQSSSVRSPPPGWHQILEDGIGAVSADVFESVLTVMTSSSSQLTCLADSLWCMSRSFARLKCTTSDTTDDQQVGPRQLPDFHVSCFRIECMQERKHVVSNLKSFTARLCHMVDRLLDGGLFSGLSTMARDKARSLLQTALSETDATTLETIQVELGSLEELVRMAASTSASALLFHCKKLAAALEQRGALQEKDHAATATGSASQIQWCLPAQVSKSILACAWTLAFQEIPKNWSKQTR